MTHRKQKLQGTPTVEQALLEGNQYSKHDKVVLTRKTGEIFQGATQAEAEWNMHIWETEQHSHNPEEKKPDSETNSPGE